MTCIVGLVHNNVIYMGGDSAIGMGGWSVQSSPEPKVFIKDRFIIGTAGNARPCQVIEYLFIPPEQLASQSDIEYLCSSFVAVMQECLMNNGVDVRSSDYQADFLVGYNKRLYSIGPDFSVVFVDTPYLCEGAGREIAQGAVDALLSNTKMSPRKIVEEALRISVKHCGGVLPPYTILELK